jgi:hypothetical protein
VLVQENVLYVSRQLNARNDKILFLLTLRSLLCRGGEGKSQCIPYKVITQVNIRGLCDCSVAFKDEKYTREFLDFTRLKTQKYLSTVFSYIPALIPLIKTDRKTKAPSSLWSSKRR